MCAARSNAEPRGESPSRPRVQRRVHLRTGVESVRRRIVGWGSGRLPAQEGFMPKDKDFKALVRALAERRGVRYTTAREELRPSGRRGSAARPPSTTLLERIIPTSLTEQRALERPAQAGRFTYTWPEVVARGWLTVEWATEAGDPRPFAEQHELAAFGDVLGGMAFWSIGADQWFDAPDGLEQGELGQLGRWGTDRMRELTGVVLGRDTFTTADDVQPVSFFGPIGAFLPDRGFLQTGRRMLVDEALPVVETVAQRAGGADALLWTGYGVTLQVGGEFHVVRDDRNLWMVVDVSDAFFDEGVEVLGALAAAAGLPELPPRVADLCLEHEGYVGTGGLAGPRTGRHYRLRDLSRP